MCNWKRFQLEAVLVDVLNLICKEEYKDFENCGKKSFEKLASG